MTIYKGGVAVFEGKQNVEKFGTHTRKLSRSEYKTIKKAFKAADFWSLQSAYKSDIPDLPKTRLSFTKKDNTKNVVGDINRPQVIKDLEKKMEAIADADGWTLRAIPDLDLPDHFIIDELIVSLRKGVDINEWVKNYADWDMKVIKKIAPSRELYLVGYDDSKLKPSQVMNALSMDEELMVLEFNKRLESRDR